MGDRIDVDSTQNIISFCTGYGGIESGIRRAGVDVRTVCNVEIEAFVQANLVAKTEEGRMDNAPIYSDLKTFPAEIFRGKIHGLIGGYPCQPFSSAGKRKGEEDPRHLWPYIRKHVRAIRPVWCFFENVRGHTTMGLWRVLSDLEEDGYRTEWGLFSAEETGAPHQRIRVFILAYSASLGGESKSTSGQPKCERLTKVANHDSGGELAYSAGDDVEGRDLRQGEVQSRGSGTQPAELAHTASREPRQSQARNGGQDIGGGSEDTQWPARPGEEQYEWEEPRVVADCSVKRCGGRKNKDGKDGEGISEQEGEERSILRSKTEGCSGDGETTHDEAQSELVRAVDGLTHRVDRLRLLGNGVVPQTAEIAWRTLWQRI